MNRTNPGIAALAILLTLSFCPPSAQAQDLGGLARGLLKRAASRDARPPAAVPARKAPPRQAEQDDPGELEAEDFDPNAAPALPAPAGFIPWPANAGDPRVVRPGQFVFAPEVSAQKERYKAASTFPCSTCEGSIDFDVWRRSFSHPNESYSSWSKILEAWTVGRTIAWKGQAHDGTITVLAEASIGPFPCRQLHHRMTSRGPTPAVVERPGLICLGRRDQYSGADTWHEVF
jgi:hypothetical protein